MELTLKGNIVIPMGLYGHADYPTGAKAATNDGDESTEVKQMLDDLHKRKIGLASEICVVVVGDHIGNSTRREISYAMANGKTVDYRSFAPYTRAQSPLLSELEALAKEWDKQSEKTAAIDKDLISDYLRGKCLGKHSTLTNCATQLRALIEKGKM